MLVCYVDGEHIIVECWRKMQSSTECSNTDHKEFDDHFHFKSYTKHTGLKARRLLFHLCYFQTRLVTETRCLKGHVYNQST